MNERWWKAVHWCALVVPYGGVDRHVRSQVSGQETGQDEEHQYQVSRDKHLTKAAARTP